jgi:histidine kinase
MRGNKLLNWISSGEFERFYTHKVRVAAHMTMWLFILIIQFMLVKTAYNESNSVTLAFAVRNVSAPLFFFYFVVYFVIPVLLLKGRIIPGIIGILLALFAYSILSYITCLFVHANLEIRGQATKTYVDKLVASGLFSKYSFQVTMKSLWWYITSVAPCLAINLALNIIRKTTSSLRMERDKLDLELNFLKSQLNPHFLFNTLNNIYTLSLSGNPLASDLILHISGMMRYTLYESDAQLVPLKKEVEFLRNYIELESVRYGPNADIRFECNEDEINEQMIGPLLVFPFVENAFKHGQNNSTGKSLVKVSIKTDGPGLIFEIINSINELKGIKKTVGGIGQANSRKRLELLYPGQHLLTIENTADLYKVKLIIAYPVNHGTKN